MKTASTAPVWEGSLSWRHRMTRPDLDLMHSSWAKLRLGLSVETGSGVVWEQLPGWCAADIAHTEEKKRL